MKKSVVRIKLKTMIIGDTDVGKSSLFYWIKEGKQPGRQKAKTKRANYGTISDLAEKIGDKPCINYTHSIWDTPSNSEYTAVSKVYYNGVDAYILLFDLNNKQTFNNLKNHMRDIAENSYSTREGYILYLVGTHADTTPAEVTQEEIGDFVNANKIEGYCCTDLYPEQKGEVTDHKVAPQDVFKKVCQLLYDKATDKREQDTVELADCSDTGKESSENGGEFSGIEIAFLTLGTASLLGGGIMTVTSLLSVEAAAMVGGGCMIAGGVVFPWAGLALLCLAAAVGIGFLAHKHYHGTLFDSLTSPANHGTSTHKTACSML